MRELLSLLPKPSRYLGIEEGSVHKPAADVRLRVGLVFPDMYEVGMSYLGQKILYGIINQRRGWQAERIFAPCRDAAAVLREHGAPLCGLESDTPLADMDAIGLSVTHELCYTNVLYVLDLAGIPLRAQQRKRPRPDGRAWPLVIAGGGCTLAAEPLAPFVDLMCLGEGEELLPEVLEIIERNSDANIGRHETLLDLARLPGVYVPEFYAVGPDNAVHPTVEGLRTPTRRVVPDLNAALYPVEQPVPFGAVHNRLALEIARGCTRACRFCQAGSLYRPARERSVAELRQLMDSCLSGTGYDDVSCLSLSTGDYSALKEFFLGAAERCAREQVSLSLPSLRVGSIDDAIMERMAGIRRTGATLAPEAGSQRLRDVINKGISEEELVLHVQKLFEHGWQQVKLYFMIGLPTETDEDLLAIVDLCRKARDAAGPGIKRMQITASLSPFVPKPHTPFQWEAQIPLEEIRRRVGVVLDAVKSEKRVTLRWHEPQMSLLEGIFSRGDRRLADVVESAYRKGAIFADWMEGFSLEPWLEAMRENGLTPEEYTRERGLDEALPWDHLESGIGREYLLRERGKALAGKTTPDCRYVACQMCGSCDTKAGPSRLDRLPGQDRPYGNILNKPQRDQEAHSVSLDQYGRVIVRGQAGKGDGPDAKPDGQQDGKPGGKPAGKSRPPALSPHLAVKAMHVGFRYARYGGVVHLSQLELQHIFDRALRRAGLPLSFSQGFHPLPLVSFGRALPVGVASEAEFFSVYLREERPLAQAVAAMNRGLPEGLRIMSAKALPPGKAMLDSARERYAVRCDGDEAAREAFGAAWQRVKAAGTLPWRRETKKGYQDLDARAFFTDIVQIDDNGYVVYLDWSDKYVSPPALCLQALSAVGLDMEPRFLRLCKLSPESVI
jgi:radical SAM family uncharacterized protein/radical SAM-linked protein